MKACDRLTISDLEALNIPVLTPAQAAGALNMDPDTIRWQAQTNPIVLGFPVIVAKRHVKIPRIPFLEFIRGKKESA